MEVMASVEIVQQTLCPTGVMTFYCG